MALNMTSGIVRDLYTNVKTTWDLALQNFPISDAYKLWCEFERSNTDTERYDFTDQLGTMLEFLDERQLRDFGFREYSLGNRKWESSVKVKREEVEDDQYGMIRRRIQGLARRAQIHRDVLATSLINNGTASTTHGACFDGQPFFSASHSWTNSEYTTAQSNIRTGTNTGKLDITYAAANIKAAIKTMESFRDNTGEFMDASPTHLMVSAQDQFDVKQTLNSQALVIATEDGASVIERGSTNPLAGQLQVIVNRRLTAGTGVLLDLSGYKPFIFQERDPLEFGSLEKESERGFMREEYVYGVRARYNVGYGLWWKAIYFDGT